MRVFVPQAFEFWQTWLGRHAGGAEHAIFGPIYPGGPASARCTVTWFAALFVHVHGVAAGLLFLFLCDKIFDSIDTFGL